MAGRASKGGPEADIERLAFFSDAVFAIALTLLAIDVRLPQTAPVTDTPSFLAALASAAPALYSFALSFFVIVLFWVGHFRTFRAVDRVDGRTIVVNAAATGGPAAGAGPA